MPFVQKQNVSVSFNGGLESKVDQLQLQPNNMLILQNARFTKDGQVSKRTGFVPLSRNVDDGSTINSSVAINTFGNELLLFDGNYLYTYLDEPDLWVNRGTAISVINSSKQVIRTITAEQINPDGCSLQGIDCFVWQDTRGGVRYTVMDSSTDSFVLQDQLIFDYNPNLEQALLRPKVMSDGTNINVFYTDGGGMLFYNQVNPARPSILSVARRAIYDGQNGHLIYDVAFNNGQFILAYNSIGTNVFFPAGYNDVVAVFPNGARVVLSSAVLGDATVGSGRANCIGVIVDSQNTVWITWALQPKDFDEGEPYTVWAAAYTLTGSQVLAPTQVASQIPTILTITCVEGVDAGSLMIAWDTTNDPDNYVSTATVQINGNVTIGPVQRGAGLASKAFKVGNNRFVNLASQSTLQSTYYTLCLNRNPMVVVGRINSQVGGGYRSNNMLAQCDPASNQEGGTDSDPNAFLVAFCKKGLFQTGNNTSFTLRGVSAEVLDFDHPNAFNGMKFNNNFLFVGACMQNYDGVSVSEQNFHQFPEFIQASLGEGGDLSAGLYQYSVTYEWTDNFGQTQYSAPSVPVSITVGINGSVDLSGPMLRITSKQNPRTPVQVAIYRTQANGPVFQLVTTIVNDVTVDTWHYTDTASDVSIGANKPLYTSSQVANSPPPSCSFMSYYQDRLLIGGLEDENLLWFSQAVFDLSNYSSIAPEFSNLFTMGVDSFRGGITALSWMDDKSLIFKKNTIYIGSGDGPNPNGTGNEFPPPQNTLSTVGCVNQNSLVVTYNGVFFQSNKGIYMIDRGTNVNYVGAAVEDQTDDLSITGAELLDKTDEVIFTTAEGIILVYNYYFNRWTTWQNSGYLQAVDATVWRDQLVIVSPQGQVLVQTPEVYTDNGNYIPLKVQTPWLQWAGIQGYQSVFKCFLLGNLKGPHLLNVSIAYDYNPADAESFVVNSSIASNNWGSLPTWGSNGPWGLNWTPYQFQINNSVHKCQSIRLTFEDSPSSTSLTEGYTLNALTFEIGILPDAARLPKGNKVAGGPVT